MAISIGRRTGLGYASTLASVLLVSLAGMVAGEGTELRGVAQTAIATTAAAGGVALTIAGWRLLRDETPRADSEKRARVTG